MDYLDNLPDLPDTDTPVSFDPPPDYPPPEFCPPPVVLPEIPDCDYVIF